VYPSGIGPNFALALDMDGSDNTGLDDLLTGTRLNDPTSDAALLHTIRNGTNVVGLFTLQNSNRVFTLGNAVNLKRTLPEYGAGMIAGSSNVLQVYNLTNGFFLSRLSNATLVAQSQYVYGHFNVVSNLGQFLVYLRGGTDLDMYQVNELSPTSYDLAPPVNFSFLSGIEQVIMLDSTGRLMVIYQNGSQADIYDFDGVTLSPFSR